MHKNFGVFLVLSFALSLLAGCTKPLATPTPTSFPSQSVQENTVTSAPPTATHASTSTQTAVPVAQPIPIYRLHMYSDGAGWGTDINGSSIFHSNDQARTWLNVTPTEAASFVGQSAPFSAFYDGQTAWLSFSQIETSSVLFHTSDGGQTWTRTILAFPGGLMYFTTPQDGYLLASLGIGAGSEYVAVYHTQDGGASWEKRFTHTPGQLEVGLPGGGIKNGIAFLKIGIGWINGSIPISNSLYLYASFDHGSSWTQQTCSGLPTTSNSDMWDAQPVLVVSPTEAFLPVRAYIGTDTIKTYFCGTVDSGATWNYLSSLPNLSGTSFADPTNGFAFGTNILFRTEDGALTWSDLSASLPKDIAVVDVSRVNKSIGYIVATDPSLEHVDLNSIYQTSDGGASWSLVPTTLLP